MKLIPFIILTIIISICGIIIDQIGWRFFNKILPKFPFTINFPAINNNILKVIDLIFGLILVGIVEEIVFRGFFYNNIRKFIKSKALIVIISCIIFGLAHWSLGFHAIITTALWGILPMIIVIKYNSILPLIIAHYITDLFGCFPILPENWFNFLK